MTNQCISITKSSERCKKLVKLGEYCNLHKPKNLSILEYLPQDAFNLILVQMEYRDIIKLYRTSKIIKEKCEHVRGKPIIEKKKLELLNSINWYLYIGKLIRVNGNPIERKHILSNKPIQNLNLNFFTLTRIIVDKSILKGDKRGTHSYVCKKTNIYQPISPLFNTIKKANNWAKENGKDNDNYLAYPLTSLSRRDE